MRITYTAENIQQLAVDSLVLFVPAYKRIEGNLLKLLDGATGGSIATLLTSGEFKGAEKETATLLRPRGFKTQRVILAGLGERRDLDADSFRRAAGAVSRLPGLSSSQSAAFVLDGFEKEPYFQAAIEGYLLGRYTLQDYKSTKSKTDKLTRLVFAVGTAGTLKRARSAVESGRIVAEGQLLVRELSAAPSNYLTPRLFAQKARALARKHSLTCTVLDEKAIRREKMGCLLGVAKGSAEPPRFIILKYRGARQTQKPIVLIGKGVTFDAGGISLKKPEKMAEMKGDMTGAAVVLATLVTAARLKLPLNLVGLLPTTENLPSGTAIKPGDVLTSRKGLTVEVINTDAEGRLILADALDYANKFSPQAVIDIATLTGASLYVLGYAGAPLLGNDEKLKQRIKDASRATAEKVWELPIWDEHRQLMKSSIADLINSAGKEAGTIAASAFLENFVGDYPWAHIDIAFMDVEMKGKPYVPKGATGFGLRLLTALLAEWK